MTVETSEGGQWQVALRPQRLNHFIGQERLVARLSIMLQAAKERAEPLTHLLLTGPPGLGKTTLAHLMAHEMDANIVVTSGPALDKPADLAGTRGCSPMTFFLTMSSSIESDP